MAKRRPGSRGGKESSTDETEDAKDESPKEQPRTKARRRRERYAKVELKRRRKRMRLIGLGIVVVVAVVLAVAVFIMTRPSDENPVVVIETGQGVIEVELFMDECPRTAGNIKDLVEQGFYNGLTFHRIVNEPSLRIMQGGDPNGDGTGGSDKTVDFEESAGRLKHVRGSVAMARSQDKNSGSSQFYICGDAMPSLDGEYAVFGKVVSGMDLVDAIIKAPTDENDRPINPVIMQKVYIKGTVVP